MSVTINYKNDTLATFRRATKTLTTKGKFLEDDISITDDTTNGSVYQDDDGYVVINDEAGSGLSLLPLNITENGTYRTNNEDTGYSPVTVNVHTDPTLQSKSVNPTESSQTVKPDTNYDGLSQVTVGAISNTYVGSSVPRMTATNLTVSGSTITTPSGYYASAVSKNVAGGTATTPGTSVTTNPTITLSNTTGVITASYNATKSITPTITAGYISAGTAGTVRYSGTATYSLSTQAAKTVTPTETAQTIVSSGYFTTGDVKVAGISSNYVGTNVTRISAADMTHSGGTVTAPSGYYASALTHAVGNGTATTPATTLTFAPAISVDAATGKITATVSGSSNITPTVTAGYVNAGTAGKVTVSGSKTLIMSTKAGTTITPTTTSQLAVSSGYYTTGSVYVGAIPNNYIIPTGTSSITTNGAFDIAQYASVNVDVQPNLDSINITPTESMQYFPSGTVIATTELLGDDAIDAAWSINLSQSFNNGDKFNISGYLAIYASGRGGMGKVYINETFIWDGNSHSFQYISDPFSFGSSTNITATYNITINTNSVQITTTTNTSVSGKVTEKSLIISKIEDTIDGYSGIIVNAISSRYVGTGISRCNETNLVASGSKIIVPTGYYYTQVSKAIDAGTATTPATTLTFAPAISVDAATGKITATINKSSNITPNVVAGYIATGTSGKITVSGSNTKTLSTRAAATITPTTTSQLAVSSGYYTTGSVYVGPIPNTYVQPTGTLTINNRGTYNVASYASITTNISGGTFVATIISTDSNPNQGAKITYNGQIYNSLSSFDFKPGEKIHIYGSGMGGTGIFYLNRIKIAESSGYESLNYDFILPASNINITLYGNSGGSAAIYIDQVAPFATPNLQSKTAMPLESSQIIVPDGYLLVYNNSTSYTISDTHIIFNYSWINTPIANTKYHFYIHFNRPGKERSYTYNDILTWSDTSQTFQIKEDGENRTLSVTIYSDHIDFTVGSTDDDNGFELEMIVKTLSAVDGLSAVYIDSGSPMDNSVLNTIINRTITGTYTNSTVSYIGSYAFANCSILSSVNFQNCTKISAYGFYLCSSLTTAIFPNVTNILGSAFTSCTKLTSISFPMATSIYTYAFWNCTSLSSINFPNITYIGAYAFRSCSKLVSISFPKATSIGSYTFGNCFSLPSIFFPSVSTIGSYAFRNCSELALVSLPAVTSIYTLAFTSCYALQSVYLFNSVVATGQANIFQSTPIALSSYLGYFGSIYVRQSLLESWKTASNWSVYADHFVGLTDAQIAAL